MEWCNEKQECPLCRTPNTHSSLVCLYHSDFQAQWDQQRQALQKGKAAKTVTPKDSASATGMESASASDFLSKINKL